MGYTEITEPCNWELMQNDVYGIPLFNNYKWENKKHNRVSFVFNPKIEFVSNFLIGGYVSGQLIVNKDRTYVGVSLGMLFGSLRNKKQL